MYQHQGRSLLDLVLLVSVFATVATSMTMEFYLFTLDDSRALAQIFWFLVLLLAPVGPALYCLVVYSRSKYFKDHPAETKTLSAQQP